MHNADVACSLQMRDMNHENVNHFIGLCTEAPNISIVTAHCSRGSLMVMHLHWINTILYCACYFIVIHITSSNMMPNSIVERSLSSDRQHLSYDGCLEVRGKIIRTVLCCIVY